MPGSDRPSLPPTARMAERAALRSAIRTITLDTPAPRTARSCASGPSLRDPAGAAPTVIEAGVRAATRKRVAKSDRRRRSTKLARAGIKRPLVEPSSALCGDVRSPVSDDQPATETIRAPVRSQLGLVAPGGELVWEGIQSLTGITRRSVLKIIARTARL
jgi:hypothetical protein